MSETLTRKDRDELVKVIRMRVKLAHADVAERQARLSAQIEQELSAKFESEDERWRDLTTEAQDHLRRIDGELANRCDELGLRPEFRPRYQLAWRSRGENSDPLRRSELRRLAKTRIESLGKSANLDIDRQAADSITSLIAGGLSSDDARAELDALPTADSLMLAPSVAELEAVYDRDRKALGS